MVDEHVKTMTSDELFDRYGRFIRWIVGRKFRRITVNYRRVTEDDLVNVGVIGMMKSKRAFNPELGIKFTTYCGRAIYTEIVRYLDKTVGITRTPGFSEYAILGRDTPRPTLRKHNSLINTYPLSELNGACCDSDEIQHVENVDFSEFVRHQVLRMPGGRRRLDMFVRQNAHGQTLDAISKLYGITRERVRQINKVTLIKLRNLLKKRGFTFEDTDHGGEAVPVRSRNGDGTAGEQDQYLQQDAGECVSYA